RDALALGASCVLPETFSRDELLAALDEHAAPIGSVAPEFFITTPDDPTAAPVWRGRVVAVTGSGGSGTSVCSIAGPQGGPPAAPARGTPHPRACAAPSPTSLPISTTTSKETRNAARSTSRSETSSRDPSSTSPMSLS